METRFRIPYGNSYIPCILSQPDDGEIRRLVLGVHGFGGSSMDVIQTGIAEEMVLFRSATIRFDLPAHGENPIHSEDLTLADCMDTLITVAAYLRHNYEDVEDLCIFATGFGAYVTLLCLQELMEMPGKIKLVVQTPALLMHETLLSMIHLSRETLRALDSYKAAPNKRPSQVRYAFYQELRDHIALTTYSLPILILHGEEDSLVSMTDIQNFHRINERSQLVIIPGTSHRFLEEGAWDMVLDLTRDWFEFEQVLLM